MLREPTESDVVTYICSIQPELDEDAARRIIRLDPAIYEGLAQDVVRQIERAETLLELHLQIEEILA